MEEKEWICERGRSKNERDCKRGERRRLRKRKAKERRKTEGKVPWQAWVKCRRKEVPG